MKLFQWGGGFRLPNKGRKPRQARLLALNQKLRLKVSGQYLEAVIPQIQDHEMLAIDF